MPDAPVAAAAPGSTLDPSLRALVSADAGKASQVARAAAQRRVALDASGRVRVLAELATGSTPAALEALGAEVTGVYGDVVALAVPVEALPALGQSRLVRRVQATRQTRRPRLHNSRGEIRADLVHAGQGLPRTVTGARAVVGAVDSGVDLSHPDFWTAANGSRFLAVRDDWPTTDRVFTRAQIEGSSRAAATTALADTFAHGTHVIGVAGASGQGNAAMKGIAPDADLVMVRSTYADDDILSGCSFVFAQARAVTKPAVCNLSLGGHAGPHDGTSAFDRAISNIVQPGYLVVASAGNEGNDYIHAGRMMTANREARVWYAPYFLNFFSEDEALIEGWYDARAITQFQINVYSFDAADNPVLAMQSAVYQTGRAVNDVLLTRNGVSYGYFSLDGTTTADPVNGDGTFQLYLYDDLTGDGYISDFVYEIAFKGTAAGRVDLWDQYASAYFVPGTSPTPPATYDEIEGGRDRSVGEPATAQKVVSVGAYANTLSWTDFNGVAQTWPGFYGNAPRSGQLSDFSSRGPTRDGRRAPVVTAPGELVFAPFSRLAWAEGQADTASVDRSGQYIGLAGTSMSAPHISGVLALMLDVNPTLTYDQAITIFQTTSRRDGFTGASPSDSAGYGKIDALAAVQAAAALVSSAEDDARATGLALDAPMPNPVHDRAVLRYATTTAAPLRLAVYDVLGREVAVLHDGTATPGLNEATVDVGALAPGTYLVRLTAGAQVRTQRLVVVD